MLLGVWSTSETVKTSYQHLFMQAAALAALLIAPALHAEDTAPAVCPITGKTGPMPAGHPPVPSAAETEQPAAQTRIITIGGAATEIVFALGKGDEVVAVDLSSTYPEEATKLPQVGYIRQISPEGVLSLNPDLIVTTESLGPPAAKAAMKRVSIPVVWCPEPESPEALYASLEEVGAALDREAQAAALIAQIQEQLTDVQLQTSQWPQAPRVVFFLQPPTASRGGMVGGSGTRADELIKLAGGVNAASDVTRFQPYSLEALIAAQPDVILLGSGLGHGAGPKDVEYLLNLKELSGVPAVKNGRVVAVPMDDLAFGPRLGDAASRWAGVIAPAPSDS
jgi:iron complex transport system substrate-binding protein